MAGVNKVILLGNLGQDPEVRFLPSGTKVANISIATTESYTNKEGQRVDQTEWHRVELWDGLAGIAEQYLKKGNPVYIEGKIRSEEYQDKNGNTARSYKIRATSINLIGSKDSSSGETKEKVAPGMGNLAPQHVQEPAPSFISSDEEDVLPF
jgi:single-strand DNA-binding protein